jgi:hypothetical protein
MPGGGWKRQARIWKKTVTRLADEPFEHVRQSMVRIIFLILLAAADHTLLLVLW